jgi:hypothetical protein
MTYSRVLTNYPIETILADADRGVAPSVPPRSNAHVHLPPNFSAFESVGQAVDLAASQDIRILGASNYYDFSIYAPFAELAFARGIYPLFGLEVIALLDDVKRAGILINDPGNPGRMYLCGKGITRFESPTTEARRLLERIRRSDEERMRRMVRLMAEVFVTGGVDTGLEEDRIIDGIVARFGVDRSIVTLQERHVAQAFQEEFFRTVPVAERTRVLSRVFGCPLKADPENGVKVQNEIRSNLMKVGKPAFVEESFVNFDQACRLILELGGIPCYPTLADGASPICSYEDPPEKLIEALREKRIYCAEFIPLRNDPKVLERYVVAFRRAGFAVTAGTEHNTLDLLPMEPACRAGAPVPAAVKETFLEGAYVVIAHQFLTLQGRPGYVDEEGNLNAAFSGSEERIDHFRRIGAAVLARHEAASHS